MRALRIGMVVESFDTGVARLVAVLAQGLAAQGHRVDVVHAMDKVDPACRDRLLATPGVRLFPLPMVRAPRPGDLAALARLVAHVRRHGPYDLLHGHSSKGGALARLAGLLTGTPSLYTPHAFYTLAPELAPAERSAYAAVERLLARLARAVVCSSEVERRHALAIGIPSERLWVVPNGIDPSPRDGTLTRAALGIPDHALVVGAVGRLAPQKRIDTLVRAIAMIRGHRDDVWALVVGDGAELPGLRELCRDLGVTDRVVFAGRQPCQDALALTDILAQPSAYEGFSLMPLEAMQAGLPIVCTDVGGVAESVVDGVTGLVVPVGDPIALARTLLDLCADPGRRLAMGQAARERAALFGPEAMLTPMLQIYRTVARQVAAEGTRVGGLEPGQAN